MMLNSKKFHFARYAVMRDCWERAPEDRPTFKDLRLNLTKYIERIAGYLEIGFNPFATDEVMDEEEKEEAQEVEDKKY